MKTCLERRSNFSAWIDEQIVKPTLSLSLSLSLSHTHTHTLTHTHPSKPSPLYLNLSLFYTHQSALTHFLYHNLNICRLFQLAHSLLCRHNWITTTAYTYYYYKQSPAHSTHSIAHISKPPHTQTLPSIKRGDFSRHATVCGWESIKHIGCD